MGARLLFATGVPERVQVKLLYMYTWYITLYSLRRPPEFGIFIIFVYCVLRVFYYLFSCIHFRVVADYEFYSCINRVFSKFRVFECVIILIDRECKNSKTFLN